MNVIVDAGPNIAFKIFIANYISGSYLLTNNNTVAHLFPQPSAENPTNINLFEVLGVDNAYAEEEKFITNEADEYNDGFKPQLTSILNHN